MPFRVLVCGSRHWSSYLPVRRELAKLPSDTIVIHGDCAGADRMAAIAAKYLDLQDVQFKADWDKHGPAAGPIRNQQMIDSGANLVLAFYVGECGKGTSDTLSRAAKAGIESKSFSE